MDNQSFLEIVGKSVTIRTLDEYITGIVKNTEGDFIIIEKQKKNGVETTYVNKNTVQTIRIK